MSCELLYLKLPIGSRRDGIDVERSLLPTLSFDSHRKEVIIEFKSRIIAADFSFYWGSIAHDICSANIGSVIIDLQSVIYANLFCISKIILCIISTEKQVTIIWPQHNERNQMLRHLFNRGILDLLFPCGDNYISNVISGINRKPINIINQVGDRIISNYNEVYDFKDCFDQAITRYRVFEYIKKSKPVAEKNINLIINSILLEAQSYFYNSHKQAIFDKIEARLSLYLYELITNVCEHAYKVDEKGVFSILITNDYLPVYAKQKKNVDGQNKFEARVNRLEKEIPEKIFGDVISRYFGGMTLFFDDIGCGIDKDDMPLGHYKQLFRNIFLEGVSPACRKAGSTSLNGLKLVADLISDNNDNFWCHDNKYWCGSTFKEYRFAPALDSSVSQISDFVYTVPCIYGVTYEIGISFAKKSTEKVKSYQAYGAQVILSFPELSHIYEGSFQERHDNNSCVVVDRLDQRIQGGTPQWIKKVNESVQCILMRLREKRKDHLTKEIIYSIFDKLPQYKKFDELVIYDLDATTLFQVRAVLETPSNYRKISDRISGPIILMSMEGHVFTLLFDSYYSSYKLKKEHSIDYLHSNRNKILIYLSHIQNNDRILLDFYIKDTKRQHFSPVLHVAKVQWEDRTLSSYLDMEQMTKYHHIYQILLYILIRVNGLLSTEYKFVFLEDFMERSFAPHVNEYVGENAKTIYIGSVIFSKKTERLRAKDDDYKIYFFKHVEANAVFDASYIFLSYYPNTKHLKPLKENYRRISNSNRIEEYSENSKEFLFYLDEKYRLLISRLDYNIGFFNDGLLEIMINQNLFSSYREFIIGQLDLMRKKYDKISIVWNLSAKEDSNTYNCETNLIEEFITSVNDSANNLIPKSNNAGKWIKENEKNPDVELHIFISLYIVDFLKQMRNSIPAICISLFNSFTLDDYGFDTVVSGGYYPFIPILTRQQHFTVGKYDVERFIDFTRSLMSSYRTSIKTFWDHELHDISNRDFSIEMLRYFNTSNKDTNILYDCIMSEIYQSINKNYALAEQDSQYELLISMIRINTGAFLSSKEIHERKITKIFSVIIDLAQKSTDDNIVLFFMLAAEYCLNIVPSWSSKDIEDLKIEEIINNNPSYLIRIMLAKILNSIDKVRYMDVLSSIFISNDIAIYYNMLYTQLFNNYGDDHDGPIGQFAKTNGVNKENAHILINTIRDCCAYLKLTKPYDKPLDEIVEIERLANDINKELEDKCSSIIIGDLIEQFKKLAKGRFFTIETTDSDRAKDKMEVLIKMLLSRLCSNNQITDDQRKFFVNYIFCEDLKEFPKSQISISIINDPFILDEIAVLINDAIKYSKERGFFFKGKSDILGPILIKCGIDENKGCLFIKILNRIDKPFDVISKEIRFKKRVGKTHLKRFNILVTYLNNTDLVSDDSIIETKIEIPYIS